MSDAFDPNTLLENFQRDMLKGLGFGSDANAQDKLKTHMAQRAEQDRAMAARVLRVFSTADGEKVLDWLVELTLRKATITRDLILQLRADQVATFSAFREGENSVVDAILSAMAQAEGRKRKKRDPA